MSRSRHLRELRRRREIAGVQRERVRTVFVRGLVGRERVAELRVRVHAIDRRDHAIARLCLEVHRELNGAFRLERRGDGDQTNVIGEDRLELVEEAAPRKRALGELRVDEARLLIESLEIEAAQTLARDVFFRLLHARLLLDLRDLRARRLRFVNVAVVSLDVVEHQECRQQRERDDDGVHRTIVAIRPCREIEMDRLHPVKTPVQAVSSASRPKVPEGMSSAKSFTATVRTCVLNSSASVA